MMKQFFFALCLVIISGVAIQVLMQGKGKTSRGRIAGVIFNEAKQPIAEAMLGITETTAQGELNEMAPMTNERGEFAWDNLPPGRYTLLVNAAGYRKQTFVVEVKANETAQTEIILLKAK